MGIPPLPFRRTPSLFSFSNYLLVNEQHLRLSISEEVQSHKGRISASMYLIRQCNFNQLGKKPTLKQRTDRATVKLWFWCWDKKWILMFMLRKKSVLHGKYIKNIRFVILWYICLHILEYCSILLHFWSRLMFIKNLIWQWKILYGKFMSSITIAICSTFWKPQ